MGQTIILFDRETQKEDNLGRFAGGPALFRAFYSDEIPTATIEEEDEEMYRPKDFEQARAWAQENISSFSNENHPLRRLLAELEANGHLWLYEIW